MRRSILTSALAAMTAVAGIGAAYAGRPDAKKIFGEKVIVFTPQDSPEYVAAKISEVNDSLFGREMSSDRYALLFEPGDYTAAGLINVPFYVHIAGLGKTPYDVRLSNIHTPPHLRDGNGTCTFWRSAENFSIAGPATYDEPETFKWAVSQAAPIRRVHSERVLRTQWGEGWVSGGFAADCVFDAPAGSDHQQQWLYRNSRLEEGRGDFREEKYNYCFVGVELGDKADTGSYIGENARDNVTFIPTTGVMREKPFLYIGDDGRYKVFRPALRRDSKGVSYTRTDMGPGESLDLLKEFYIVKRQTPASEINRQLKKGKNILFTPGMYTLDEPLVVDRPDAIVMGLGWATLIPGEKNSDTAIKVADTDGVTIASLLFDSHWSSRTLIEVGEGKSGKRHHDNPVLLSDLFFRIGGFRPAPVHVDHAVEINSNDVIGDHFWIWRADHGVRGSVGWDVNTARNGLVVNGDGVSIYGLFNEHFQEYQTLWNGEDGLMIFYQCETPYDAPVQSAYMSHEGTTDGYAAYKVADHVKRHDARAMGIYDVIFKDIRIANSVEAPETEGVTFTNLCNNSLSSPGPRGIGFLINGKIKSTYNTWRDNLVRMKDNRKSNVRTVSTTSDRSLDLSERWIDFDTATDAATPVLTLDPADRRQPIDGFGAAITGSTAYNLLKMSEADRSAFLKATFSPTEGYGMSYVRIPIGASDFSLSDYTCCDTPGIENFALTAEETDYIIPVMKEILAINPEVKVISAPWTAPRWMKVDNLKDLKPFESWTSGQLNPALYADYAEYFARWIKAFGKEGIKIYGVTPQNEPLNRGNSASMYMGWEEQRDFIKNALGPRFEKEGIKTKIYAFDHNYNYDNIAEQQDYPVNIYRDAEASRYIAGAAYHNYGGAVEELDHVREAAPDKELVFTESTAGNWNDGANLERRLVEDMEQICLSTVNKGCRGSVIWNLMLDSNRGPWRPGGCSTGFGAVDIADDYKTIRRNSFYYIMAHSALAAQPGASLIGVRATEGDVPEGVAYSAFANPDGTLGIALSNRNDHEVTLPIGDGSRSFTLTLPAKSITTARWAAPGQE